MSSTETQFDIEAIHSTWLEFDALAHLRPINNEAEYVRMTALMNSLLEVAGDDENHPLSGLLDLVSDIVSSYEQKHYAIETADTKAR